MKSKLFSIWLTVLFIFASAISMTPTSSDVGQMEYLSIKGLQNESLFVGDSFTVFLPFCFDSPKSKAVQTKVKFQMNSAGTWRSIGTRQFEKSPYCKGNPKLQYLISFKYRISKVGDLELRMIYPGSETRAIAQVYSSRSERDRANAKRDEINIESGDIDRILTPFNDGKLAKSEVGLFLRKTTNENPSYSKNGSVFFEPASSIKTLIGLAVMLDVARGNLKVDDAFIYFNYPNSTFGGGKYTCPIPSDEKSENAVTTSISEGYRMMMQDSDNRTTRGFVRLIGLKRINELAKSIGMKDTSLEQDFLGCGWRDKKQNVTTLQDLSRLYASAASLEFLPNTNKANETFWNGMLYFYYDSYLSISTKDKLANLINQEAKSLEIPDSKLSLFKVNFWYRGKGGSYDMDCNSLGNSNGYCDQLRHLSLHRSFFASICIPILRAPNSQPECERYEGGWFAKGMVLPQGTPTSDNPAVSTAREEYLLFSAFLEVLRPEIRRALQTFKE